MKRILTLLILCLVSFQFSFAQNFGDFPTIKKKKLLNDLELLYQGLDKFHSGMYWYTSKEEVDSAFQEVKNKITTDLNALEFHKLIAPLVSLSREAHTSISLPDSVRKTMRKETRFMPLTVVFLGKTLYCSRNGSSLQNIELEGKQIEAINGESVEVIFNNLENFLISDGYIKTSKYWYLREFSFSKYYFKFYGQINQFNIKFKGIKELIKVEALRITDIKNNLTNQYKKTNPSPKRDLLEYRILNDSTAYLGVHSFSNSDIKEKSKEKDFKLFLKNSFKSMHDDDIKTLIIDVSKNSGGTEGNGSLLYSYLGNNFQKYKKVRANTQKAVLDNGVDKPIKLKTFGFLERVFVNKKMKDGSHERRESIGKGLMAYKKEPNHKFSGKTYIIIGPVTYSGGSEFSNLVYTNELATFVGQETGGGYYGNTSGYSKKLVLPNSKIKVYIPTLQFVMNVKPILPFGSGVIPHHEVIPTFEEYKERENAPLNYILNMLEIEK